MLHGSYKITFLPCTADVSGVGWAIYSSAAGGSSYLASPLVAFHLPFCCSLLMLLKILSMDFYLAVLAKHAPFFLSLLLEE